MEYILRLDKTKHILMEMDLSHSALWKQFEQSFDDLIMIWGSDSENSWFLIGSNFQVIFLVVFCSYLIVLTATVYQPQSNSFRSTDFSHKGLSMFFYVSKSSRKLLMAMCESF